MGSLDYNMVKHKVYKNNLLRMCFVSLCLFSSPEIFVYRLQNVKLPCIIIYSLYLCVCMNNIAKEKATRLYRLRNFVAEFGESVFSADNFI